MAVNLKPRHQAQNAFLKQQSYEKITRAANAKTRRLQIFLPSSLFFKEDQAASTTYGCSENASQAVEVVRPWNRSLTRTDALGHERKPSHIIWVVMHGRLKRCSPERHA